MHREERIAGACLLPDEQSCAFNNLGSRTGESKSIRYFKKTEKFTSAQIIREIENSNEGKKWLLDKFRYAASRNSRNTNYQFWQKENHAEELLKFTKIF